MSTVSSSFPTSSLLSSHRGLKSEQNSSISTSPCLFSLIQLCSSMKELTQMHAHVIKNGLTNHPSFLNNLLSFSSLSHSGDLNYARSLVYYHSHPPNTFAWNTLIRAYSLAQMPQHSIILYIQALQKSIHPDRFTFPILAKACSMLLATQEGKQIHAQIIKNGFNSDLYSRNSLIHLYAKCGCLDLARQLFDKTPLPDVVSWTAIVTAYAREGDLKTASQLFDKMPERNVISWTAMVCGYASIGDMQAARQVFDKMPERDIIAWTAMINGYLEANCFKEVLMLFYELQLSEVKLDNVVLIGILSACASLGSLEQGQWIHTYIRKKEIRLDAKLGASLIDMYSKCGSIEKALEVFHGVSSKVLCAWNSMIAGLAMHGQSREALDLFSDMEMEGLRPDDITFINILNACAHAGMVEEGKRYFHRMKRDYHIAPKVEHYGCMVNLLARAGLLVEAEKLIESMTVKPDAIIWGTLVAACRIQGNVEIGEQAGKHLMELEPNNGGRYVLLSNIYATAARWDKVGELRQAMKERGITKTPGCTSLHCDGVVHEFVAGDTRHPQSESIYFMLDKVFNELKMEGYSRDISKVFLDVDEETKESSVGYHSEKLAIAFGLLNSSSGTVIRIVKNLRFCQDCHRFIKHVSSVYNREIIARDRIRFHHFKNGLCSCMDFW